MHLYNRTCVCIMYPHMYLCIMYACVFTHLRIMYIGLYIYIYSMYVLCNYVCMYVGLARVASSVRISVHAYFFLYYILDFAQSQKELNTLEEFQTRPLITSRP
jgi:hypothetical protein